MLYLYTNIYVCVCLYIYIYIWRAASNWLKQGVLIIIDCSTVRFRLDWYIQISDPNVTGAGRPMLAESDVTMGLRCPLIGNRVVEAFINSYRKLGQRLSCASNVNSKWKWKRWRRRRRRRRGGCRPAMSDCFQLGGSGWGDRRTIRALT